MIQVHSWGLPDGLPGPPPPLPLTLGLVLATVPNSQFGSRSGSSPERDNCNMFHHTKIRTIAIWTILPPISQHVNFTTLDPMKYLSSDHIMTWSICKLCSIGRSFTYRCQIYDRTNIHRAAIKNPQLTNQIWHYFAVIQEILVTSQIWMREVEELLKLHTQHIDHVTIQSEWSRFLHPG